MLVLALHDIATLLDLADLAGGDERRGAARHRPGVRRRPAGAATTDRPGRLGRADRGRRWPARRSSRRTPDPRTPGSRTPTRCGARRRCTARPGTPSSTPPWIAERELASAIDNPVVLPDGRVESNGNFHGAPVAAVLDFLAISVADVASISERRTDRMLDPARSHGLPPFLAHEVGVDSGHMIAQYTQAGMVAELKRLAVPASVDSIPTLGDAGGPRVAGLARGPQAAPGRGRLAPGAGHRDAHRRQGAGPAGATAARARSPARRWTRSARSSPVPAPIATWPPRSTPWSGCSRGRLAVRRRPPDEGELMPAPTRCPPGPCPPRHHPAGQVVGHRGAAADAAEQPRPRGRRGSGQSGRLRRHRPGRPGLGQLRRDLPLADRHGRDETLLVQSGRPVGHPAHPRVGAAGADRQLEPGARTGPPGRSSAGWRPSA